MSLETIIGFCLLAFLMFFSIFAKHWIVYTMIITTAVGIMSMSTIAAQLTIPLWLICGWSVIRIAEVT